MIDSGVGGLSVLQAISQQVPDANLLYFADTAFGPYGDKSPAWIAKRCQGIAEHLIAQGTQILVLACNTATVSAITALRETIDIPVVGIEPAVKPAAQITRTGVIGVLATEATTSASRLEQLCRQYASQITVMLQPCPGLACAIEEGRLSRDEMAALLKPWVMPMVEARMDTLVLGCTHYRFVADVLGTMVGKGVSLIHPEHAVARQVERKLNGLDVVSSQPKLATKYLCSAHPERFSMRASRLLGNPDIQAIPAV